MSLYILAELTHMVDVIDRLAVSQVQAGVDIAFYAFLPLKLFVLNTYLR